MKIIFTAFCLLVATYATSQDLESCALEVLSGAAISETNCFVDVNGDGVRDGTTAGFTMAQIYAVTNTAFAAREQSRQAAKPLALKKVENDFLKVCQQLTGKLEPLGFDALQAIIEGLMATDPNTAVALSLKLLTIDAAGKREGGLKWFDDVAWHTEIVK
jgi:hypothetical protein